MVPQNSCRCQGSGPSTDGPSPSLEALVERVAAALLMPLPGASAQRLMSVQPRTPLPEGTQSGDLRQSAVLVLIYPHEETLWLPLVRRSGTLRQHGGQLALPGGRHESGDTSLWATAVRETAEEIGVDPHEIRCLGALTELEIAVSSNMVHPFVGYVDQRPCFRLQQSEVAGLLQLPLEALLDDENKHVEEWDLPGRRAQVPFYCYQDAVIWGATAMILSEFEVLLRRVWHEKTPRTRIGPAASN